MWSPAPSPGTCHRAVSAIVSDLSCSWSSACLRSGDIRRDWPKLKQKIGIMIFLSATGGGAFGTLQFVALQYTTAINMGVVGSVAPAFIVAASFILFGDRMGFTQLTGVAISLRPACWQIVTQLHPENLASLAFNAGDLIIITNMVLWAIYCACLRARSTVHP